MRSTQASWAWLRGTDLPGCADDVNLAAGLSVQVHVDIDGLPSLRERRSGGRTTPRRIAEQRAGQAARPVARCTSSRTTSRTAPGWSGSLSRPSYFQDSWLSNCAPTSGVIETWPRSST